MERRYVTVDTEMRTDKQGRIEGYASLFDVWSSDLGGFREVVYPGAFSKTIREHDIRALFNHDANYVLGRNRANTLELAEDSRGLHFRATPPQTSWVDDLRVSIGRGDIDQGSFGFRTMRDEWLPVDVSDGLRRRGLIEAKLFDVSVVTFPAYGLTDVGVRSVDVLSQVLPLLGDCGEREVVQKALSIISGMEARGRNVARLLATVLSPLDDEGKNEILRQLALALGVGRDIVDQIVSGQIMCPFRNFDDPVAKFGQVAEVTGLSVEALIEAANGDGCEYEGQAADQSGTALHHAKLRLREVV